MICVSVHGLDIVMNCETVRDGDVSTFTGTLYKENISVCTVLHPTKVIFQLKYPSTVTENLCVHPLSPCNNTVNAKGCRCVSDGADAYTFEFNFRFNKSKHEGSKLCFFSDCVGIKNLDRSDPCNLKEGIASNSLSICLSLFLSLSLSACVCVCVFVCVCVCMHAKRLYSSLSIQVQSRRICACTHYLPATTR